MIDLVLALPKTAGTAQTHKSMSFIWIVWSTLYVYLWLRGSSYWMAPNDACRIIFLLKQVKSRATDDSFKFCSLAKSIHKCTLAWPHFCRTQFHSPQMPKNLSQLVIFVIKLAFTWSWVDKNHQNLIFIFNFLCQK